MSLQITAIILAKNEENNIVRCIQSVAFCDEILVINDNSTDDTIKIVNSLNSKKTKIIPHNLDNNFSQARNFGLQKSRNEWVLFIDSDEVVSGALAYEISNTIGLKYQNLRDFNGFYIKRSDFIWSKQLKYGETGDIKLLRLGRKGFGEWIGMVHEEWQIKGKVGELINPIIHYPHQTIEEFLKEINYYTNIRAQELRSKDIKDFFWSIFLYPLGKFMFNYLLKRGFMDGIHGLVFAIIMSFHSFLVRGKLWLLSHS